MSHIATTNTFFIDAPTAMAKCWICTTVCKHEFGWVGVRCSTCGSVWEMEMTMPDIVRMRREKIGLSRREIANQLGYSIHTIRGYENYQCSMPYFQHTKKLMLNHITIQP